MLVFDCAYIHLRVGHLMPTLMSIRHHLYANSLVCSSSTHAHKGISMIVRLSRALLLVRLVLCCACLLLWGCAYRSS